MTAKTIRTVLLESLAEILGNSGQFATDPQSMAHLAEIEQNLNGLSVLGIHKADLQSTHAAVVFPSALAYIRHVEHTHLALLNADANDAMWGTDFEMALGNYVFGLCQANGIDLSDDKNYCLKADAAEICLFNLARIDQRLALH